MKFHTSLQRNWDKAEQTGLLENDFCSVTYTEDE